MIDPDKYAAAIEELARAAAQSQGWDPEHITWAAHGSCPDCGATASLRSDGTVACGRCLMYDTSHRRTMTQAYGGFIPQPTSLELRALIRMSDERWDRSLVADKRREFEVERQRFIHEYGMTIEDVRELWYGRFGRPPEDSP